MSDTLPIVMTKAGAQPQSPSDLRAQLVELVAATNPGYTANLPGSLIEDICSTDVGALTLCDQAFVDLVNSLTPYGANEFLLTQLGNIYLGQTDGQGVPFNTSVNVVFSGPPGLIIGKGFIVSDGTYQYTVQDGGIIASGGSSSPLYCLANTPGSWTIAPASVTQTVTQPPPSISPPLTLTNPLAGTPGGGAETDEAFRARVLQAGLVASQGMATMLKTLLGKVSGVQPRLVSVLQSESGGWEVMVGGGDPYEVAYAIYTALFDISTLVGSVLEITDVTKVFQAAITTAIDHGYLMGQQVTISGAMGMTGLNGGPYDITTIDSPTEFTIDYDSTAQPDYTGGGVVSPDPRNVSVNLYDYPNSYTVLFVQPLQQTVSVSIIWNTTSPNFVSAAAIAQTASPAIVAYINSLAAGTPINLLELETVFQASIAAILTPQLLTRLVVAVDIDGISTPPVSGTVIIEGDPEGYFLTDSTQIAITQG